MRPTQFRRLAPRRIFHSVHNPARGEAGVALGKVVFQMEIAQWRHYGYCDGGVECAQLALTNST